MDTSPRKGQKHTFANDFMTIQDRTSIAGIPLFSHLSRKQLDAVEELLHLASYRPGDTIIEEGSPGYCLLYIIIEGEASLCKKGRSPTSGISLDYEIEVRGRHEMFGAVSVLDGQALPITVLAKTPLTVAILDLKRGNPTSPASPIRNVLVTELRRYLGNYVRTSLDYRVDSLQRQAEFARYRNAVGSILIAALALLSFYTLALSTLPRFENYLGVNFALSPIIILFFAAFFFPLVRRSGFPAAFFGVRFDNWRGALSFAIPASFVFIAIGVFIKWLLIETLPSLGGLRVVSFADVRIGGTEIMNSPWYWAAVFLYLLLTPVQEFVARSGIQTPLYAFLQGSELKRRAVSIIVSNLVFSAAHAHIGLAFALATFVPGLFWAWIFIRTNSLLAASLSHLIVGGAGIFLFGIQELVQKLA
jgi:membrane protease YdiL (CAAX protease family)